MASSGLGRSASDPGLRSSAGRSSAGCSVHANGEVGELVPIKEQGVRRRAAEIVACSSLISHSSTGMLQHTNLPRLQHALQEVDAEICEDAQTKSILGEKRSKMWARTLLLEQKVKNRARPPKPQTENHWVLRRGTWYFEGGPERDATLPIKLVEGAPSADEALAAFIRSEEERGRGPRYTNGVASAGLLRRWQKRNPNGGFYDEN
eukprot:TRINITY_DN9559_c3_g1_i1.p1 TRINITY_DN9559_c3_g1~~TRINITY_DN9559_c3_g1_i1.p1  ORF type:complete len:206 (-),score=26.62 TRINITY_DN9559_c3_g1_i1:44-661(-)